MIFNVHNTDRARVYDVDTKQEITQVVSVDTDAMEILCVDLPLRVFGDGIAMIATRYRAIHPIYAGRPWPCLFHCYGAIE